MAGNWRLRRARLERNHTQESLAEALTLHNWRKTPDAAQVTAVMVSRWESGMMPRRKHRILICSYFDLGPDALGFVPSEIPASLPAAGNMPDVERRTFLKLAGLAAFPPDQLARLVSEIARESRAHVAHVEISNVGPATIERLAADVSRISKDLVVTEPLSVFSQLVIVRDDIYVRLAGKQYPAQTADLHLLAGQCCALLANISLDMAQQASAAQMAQSAFAYGEIIAHDDLKAFARATQSLVAYWSENYRDAMAYAQAGQEYATSPNIRARLLALEARAAAKFGNARAVETLLGRADDIVGSESRDDLTALGGHCQFSPAKLSYYATNAFADLGQHSAAIAYGERSIARYEATPAVERSFGDQAGCYTALAEVSIRQGSIDGAHERLSAILQLPVASRIDLLRDMLGNVRAQAGQIDGSEARALVERIESF